MSDFDEITLSLKMQARIDAGELSEEDVRYETFCAFNNLSGYEDSKKIDSPLLDLFHSKLKAYINPEGEPNPYVDMDATEGSECLTLRERIEASGVDMNKDPARAMLLALSREEALRTAMQNSGLPSIEVNFEHDEGASHDGVVIQFRPRERK